MGLGDTAKKISALTTKAESIYRIATELHEKITALREEINEMRESMKTLDAEMEAQSEDIEDQRKILTALAEEQGLDVDQLLADPSDPEGDETDSEHSEDDGAVGEEDSSGLAMGDRSEGGPTDVETADITPSSNDTEHSTAADGTDSPEETSE